MKLFRHVKQSQNDDDRKPHASARANARELREQRALLAARALVDRMRTMYRELERLTGAPITAHRALISLGNEPGMAASKLATSLGMKRPAVSHIINDLVDRGWIERVRHVDDQRSVRLFVTAEGKKILKATSGRAVATLQRAMGRLSDAELISVAGALETLLSNLPELSPRVKAESRQR